MLLRFNRYTVIVKRLERDIPRLSLYWYHSYRLFLFAYQLKRFHRVTVTIFQRLRAYRGLDWHLPIWGICGFGVTSSYRWTVWNTQQQWDWYCCTVAKHDYCEETICEDFWFLNIVFHSIGRVSWEDFISYSEVRHKVLGFRVVFRTDTEPE